MTKAADRRVNIIQGEYNVSTDPDVVFSTILGSCIAACIRDPVAGVGGMNHFLLPGDNEAKGSYRENYGVHLMELLLNGLIKKGAKKSRMEAKIFGGARTLSNFTDIGQQNINFAEKFLTNENISIINRSVGGDQGRRIQFWPVSGRARQFMIPRNEVIEKPAPVVSSDVELFI